MDMRAFFAPALLLVASTAIGAEPDWAADDEEAATITNRLAAAIARNWNECNDITRTNSRCQRVLFSGVERV